MTYSPPESPSIESTASQDVGAPPDQEAKITANKKRILFTFPIRVQLPIAIFILCFTAIFLIEGLLVREFEKLSVEQSIDNLKQESRLIELNLVNLYEKARNNLIFISHAPQVEAIIKSTENENPKELNKQYQQLEVLFSELLKSDPHFQEIQFILATDKGQEILRAFKIPSGIRITPQSKLQNQSYQPYFIPTLAIDPGDIYYTEIQPERSHSSGEVIHPVSPVFHAATPVFDPASGKIFGIIVLSVKIADYLKDIKNNFTDSGNIYIANQKGEYVYHHDIEKTFAEELDHNSTLQSDFPSLFEENHQNSEESSFFNLSSSKESPLIGIYSTLEISHIDSFQSLTLLATYDSNNEFNLINKVRDRSLAISISLALIALIFTAVIVRKISQRLSLITDALREYDETGSLKKFPTNFTNELGTLANAFVQLLTKLIHQSKLQETATKNAQELSWRLEISLEAAKISTWDFDIKAGEITADNRFYEIIEAKPGEKLLRGGIIRSMIHPEDADALGDIFYRPIKNDEPIHSEFRIILPSKQEKKIALHAKPILDQDNKPVRVLGIARDITKEDKLQKELNDALIVAQESTRLKSEFLASMSHEIRTPMNGVMGMLGLLLRGSLNDQQRHYANLAKSSANSLLTLINDILDFSKIEAGKLEFDIIDFDLNSMLSEFAEVMALRAQNKGLEFVFDFHEMNLMHIKGDPSRIRQILTNLVGNAIKFTSSGEIILKISLKPLAENIILEGKVIDTGIGIHKEKIPSLFEAFTQADTSTTREYGGTGLGLAIVKQLCELMNGSISVESEPGKGSEFTFSIELKANSPEKTVLPTINMAEASILIVDDNQTNREVLKRQLNSWGAEVDEAENGRQALQIMKERHKPFDIAIIDMQMPIMDGEQLGSRIHSDEKLSHTKLILMTSISTQRDCKHLAELGFSAYFSKPATFSDLYDALSIVLSGEKVISKVQPLVTHDNLRNFVHSPKGKKILLVEDNRINQEVALGALEHLGYETIVANNGKKALIKLAHHHFDLILMDCQMPELDGYEATRQIRSDNSEKFNSNIPIVAMTANAMQGDRDKCLQAGMNDYIAKPIEESELDRILIHWLGKDSLPEHAFETKESSDTETSASLPIWDRESALSRVRNNEDRLQLLISMFPDETRSYIEDLEIAINDHNFVKAKSMAHALKGVAATLSALALQDCSQKAESAATTGDALSLQKLAKEIRKHYQELLDTLAKQQTPKEVETTFSRDVSIEEIRQAFSRIKEKLASGNYVNPQDLDSIPKTIKDETFHALFEQLHSQIVQIDTAKAIETIKQLHAFLESHHDK